MTKRWAIKRRNQFCVLLIHLCADHDCESSQGELVDPVEDAWEGNVLDHLRQGLGDRILEALACSHRWVPLLLKLKEEGALRRSSGSHPLGIRYEASFESKYASLGGKY